MEGDVVTDWDIANWLQLLANISTFLGFPVAILVFAYSVKVAVRDRELGTYSSLDDKYLDYLRLCIEHPKLNLYYIEAQDMELSATEQTARYALFETLVTLMERAFLLYSDHSEEVRKRQWAGWDEYCSDWARQARFQRLWDKLGTQFDSRFVEYMDKKVAEAKSRAAQL